MAMQAVDKKITPRGFTVTALTRAIKLAAFPHPRPDNVRHDSGTPD
jgi:hypothetical protein